MVKQFPLVFPRHSSFDVTWVYLLCRASYILTIHRIVLKFCDSPQVMSEGFYTGRLFVELCSWALIRLRLIKTTLKAIFGRSISFLSRRHDVNTKYCSQIEWKFFEKMAQNPQKWPFLTQNANFPDFGNFFGKSAAVTIPDLWSPNFMQSFLEKRLTDGRTNGRTDYGGDF